MNKSKRAPYTSYAMDTPYLKNKNGRGMVEEEEEENGEGEFAPAASITEQL